MKEKDVIACLKGFDLNDKINVTASKCGCPLACKETKITSQISYRDRHTGYGYDLSIKYEPFEYTHVKEIPEYPIEQFFADLGGLA